MSGAPKDYYDKYYGADSEPYTITSLERLYVHLPSGGNSEPFIIYYRTYKKRVRNIVWAIDEMGAFVEALKVMEKLKAKSDYVNAKKQGANQ